MRTLPTDESGLSDASGTGVREDQALVSLYGSLRRNASQAFHMADARFVQMAEISGKLLFIVSAGASALAIMLWSLLLFGLFT